MNVRQFYESVFKSSKNSVKNTFAGLLYPKRKNGFSNLLYEATKGMTTSTIDPFVTGFNKMSPNKIAVPHRDGNWKLYQEVYERVPVVKNAIDNTANFAIQSGYQLEGDKGSAKEFIEKYNFDIVLINIIKQLQIFGNAYLEIGDNMIKLLPPDQMFVVVSKGGENDGEVIGYKQKTDTITKEIDFLPDEIVHFKWNEIGSSFYGLSDIKSALTTLTRILNVQEDLGEMIHRYANPIVHWMLGTPESPATESQISDFIDKLNQRSVGEDLVTSTAVDHKVVAANIKALQPDGMLKHFENQLIAAMNVPEIFIRGGETSNKATADVELQSFDRKVKAIRKVVSTMIEDNIDAFKGVKIVWNEMSIESEATKADMVANLVYRGRIPPRLALKMVGWGSWVDEFDQEDELPPQENDFQTQAEWIEALRNYNLKRGSDEKIKHTINNT